MKTNQKFKNHTLVLVCLICVSFNLYSQKVNSDLESLFDSLYEKNKIGASIIITSEDEILFEKNYGNATEEKINGNTQFPIGSITKQFTAASILILEEQGKLDMRGLIGEYLKDFNPKEYPVTIENLLTHTSGIASDNKNKDISKLINNGFEPKKIKDILSREPLAFAPGTKYDYSNNGYILLGLIIEEVSNMSYSKFIEKNIFKKLGMNNSFLSNRHSDFSDKIIGYDSENNQVNKDNRSTLFSAGGIVSTTEDLKEWLKAIFDNRLFYSGRSHEEMFRNREFLNGQKLNIGLGWEINEIQGKTTYEHSGSLPGFKANVTHIPYSGISIIILQNSEFGSPVTASTYAGAIMLDNPYPKINELPKEKSFRNFEGTYEFEGGRKRAVFEKNDGLYYKVPGGRDQKLYVVNDTLLVFRPSFRQLIFSGDRTIIEYQNRNYRAFGKKISGEVEKENKEIELSESILQKYVGKYESPQFSMNVLIKENKLFAQPDGSDALRLIPKSENQFFIKELGAEISFFNKEGNLNMKILLEGNEMIARRK